MIIFLTFYILITKKSFKINVQDSSFSLLLLMSLVSVAAYSLYCIGVSEEYTAIVAPIIASSPLVAVVLARIFLKERIRPSQTAGIIVILLGLILISI
jgi:drug/metabolite transporter (DMT)-like permease